MTARIAHISDVHWESGDQAVTDRLAVALAAEHPDVLVFTGDLVNNPWRVPWAKPWLMDLCRACQIDPDKNLLVIPGNHDNRLLGNFGFRPLTGLPFRLSFRKLMRRRIVRFADLGVTFFRFDSNPLMLGFARGKIGWWEFYRLKREWNSLSAVDRTQIDSSVKIALVHHHPVPIPFEGSDRFLVLKDAHRFMQFLAERKIDVVLHGHMHRAPYSLVSLGTCGKEARVLEVLGAGSVIKYSPDHDPRGHNFNLLCVESRGLRYVRQFFALPGGDFSELPAQGFPIHSFEQAWQRAFCAGHKYSAIRWEMDIDVEGDRFNELSYEGLQALQKTELRAIKMPTYKLDTGHLSTVWLNPRKTSSGVSIKITKKVVREIEFEIHFEETPKERDPARFAVQSYDWNACSLNLAEFRKKFPARPLEREWEEKTIRVPVDEFSWTIRFPRELKFDRDRLPEFEVWEDNPRQKHAWLTAVLQPAFYFSENLNTAFLTIHKPPVGFLYRIFWHLPSDSEPTNPARGVDKFRVDKFANSLLSLAAIVKLGQPWPPQLNDVKQVLEAYATLVAQRIHEKVGTGITIDVKHLDVSLMVYDKGYGELCPQLRVVSCSGEQCESFFGFSLEVGDGNAGRAYKNNVVRCYDHSVQDPKRNTYVQLPGHRPHQVLFSIPLCNPDDPTLLYGIVNVGVLPLGLEGQIDQANLLRELNNEKDISWLFEQAQIYVLQRLRQIASI
jgi:predicted MPP superfamily phosphohydrolase